MKKYPVLLIILLLTSVIMYNCRKKPVQTLKVSEINPRYFTDSKGKAVYLTGSHTWNNLVDMVPVDEQYLFDFQKYLSFLKGYNHNFFRLWAWDLVFWDTRKTQDKNSRIHTVAPQPWLRTGSGTALDGKPKFDLTRFNPDYFARLKERVEAAENLDIYVAVMLFEGWGLQFAPDALQFHPFHPLNNINQIDIDIIKDSTGLGIYQLVSNKITRLQEAYVDKVIETLGEVDNVLYEISNENHPLSTEWQYHMIRYIKSREQEKGYSHPVGMTFQYRGGSNQTLFDSPADWISPNPDGGYRDDPPANTGDKVIISDTDHLWGIGGNRQWVWKTFLRGMYPIFMDPYDGKILEKGVGENWLEEVRKAMGYTRVYAEKMDLIHMVPEISLSSSGYCLANKGREYLIFISQSKEVTVDLSSESGDFNVEWFDSTTGDNKAGESVKGGQNVTFILPFKSNEGVLYLKIK